MFIHDFKELEQEMQAQVVCMRGQYLGERARDGWLIVLYQVGFHFIVIKIFIRNN